MRLGVFRDGERESDIIETKDDVVFVSSESVDAIVKSIIFTIPGEEYVQRGLLHKDGEEYLYSFIAENGTKRVQEAYQFIGKQNGYVKFRKVEPGIVLKQLQ